MATKKRKSGVNIPNSQRTTVQILLRLQPDVAEDLDALTERWGMNRSQCVARLVAMKKHEPFIQEGVRRMRKLEEDLETSGATQHKSEVPK